MTDFSPSTAVLAFESTVFEVVDGNNNRWLRGPQIADALGMRDRRGIHDLYTRNADEFDDTMTQVIKLPDLRPRTADSGQEREVRIFSLRGAYLLAMFARTDKARAFRSWLLDVIEGRVLLRQPKPATVPQMIALGNHRMKLLATLEKTTSPAQRRAIHEQLAATSMMMGLSVPPLDELGRDVIPEPPCRPQTEAEREEAWRLANGMGGASHD